MVATDLESGLGLDLLNHGVRQRLVKLRERGESAIMSDDGVLADLLEDLHGQLGGDGAAGD